MTEHQQRIGEGLRLAIVCPMANESDSAERFIREILDVTSTFGFAEVAMFVILDNASQDGTRELLDGLATSILALNPVYAPENRGVVDAYKRGYREALTHGYDWILEIDAGYSHQPVEAARFLALIPEDVDCVFATRFRGGGQFEGGLSRRYLVSRLGSALAQLLLGGRLSDMTSGFQLFSRKALQNVLAPGLMSRGPFFQTEMKHHAAGLRVREVPITYRPTAQTVRHTALLDALAVLGRLSWRRVTGAGDRHARLTPP